MSPFSQEKSYRCDSCSVGLNGGPALPQLMGAAGKVAVKIRLSDENSWSPSMCVRVCTYVHTVMKLPPSGLSKGSGEGKPVCPWLFLRLKIRLRLRNAGKREQEKTSAATTTLYLSKSVHSECSCRSDLVHQSL